jgi:hypothetical protein
MIRKHAFDPVMSRQLFSIAIASAEALPRIELPAANFACLLAWDARGQSAAAVSSLVEPLLHAGASYFVCWGPDCERVHDIIDEIVSFPANDFDVPADSCIMTTWHVSESLGEALSYFLEASWPDEQYIAPTRAALAVSVGGPVWAEEIAIALDDPHEFSGRTSKNGAA